MVSACSAPAGFSLGWSTAQSKGFPRARVPRDAGARRFGLSVLMVAGALTEAGAAWLDIVKYYPDWSTAWMATYVAIRMVGAALVAAVGSWLLVRALRSTGVLSALASMKPA